MSSSVQKLATEDAHGTFTVRTQGIARHAELEIIGVPRVAVEPAAKLIDFVFSRIIAKGAQLKKGENVGIPLSIAGHAEIPAVFVGAHAIEAEPAAGGFLSLFGRGSKGTIRLTDLVGRQGDTPLGALSTIMLYRANCRLVTGDRAAALDELRASIELMPGDGDAGAPPPLDTRDAQLNWQNHLSYLRLAELVDDEREHDDLRREVYTRLPWLAERDLGATMDELRADAGDLAAEARRVLTHNLAHLHLEEGPHPGLRRMASPVWSSRGPVSVRVESLMPAALADDYGERLRDPATSELAVSVSAEVASRFAATPWRLADATRGARASYIEAAAPIAVTIDGRTPFSALLSATLAEVARYLAAGATKGELRAAFGLTTDRASLDAKLAAYEAWEATQYARALER